MSDWIKVRADQIKLAEKEKKEERDRQIETANILKAKVEPFWNSLVGILRDSVAEFNVEFPEAERKIDHFEKSGATTVTIKRTVYPSALVRAQLNSGTSVHYTISRTHRKGTDSVERQGNFVFGVVDGDVGYVDGGVVTHEDVARLFLEPFFQF